MHKTLRRYMHLIGRQPSGARINKIYKRSTNIYVTISMAANQGVIRISASLNIQDVSRSSIALLDAIERCGCITPCDIGSRWSNFQIPTNEIKNQEAGRLYLLLSHVYTRTHYSTASKRTFNTSSVLELPHRKH